MVVLGIIAAVIVSLSLIGMLLNHLLFRNELESISPYGQMVEVNGRKMHVFTLGNGAETIVLLPGLGVPLPSADFGPLMRELSQNYTVATVEYFGVGFSETAASPRTNANYTEEIRAALDKAGLKPPYILMPHSASGIYCEHYAAMYPEEVSAIIMLDTTSTAETNLPAVPRFVYSIAKFQQATGLSRLLIRFVPETKAVENGYSKQEVADYKRFYTHVINDTFVDQSVLLKDNIIEVSKTPFPSQVPVLKLISQVTVDTMSKKDKAAGMKYQEEHLKRLGEGASYRMVAGSHFLYHTQANEIVRLTQEFLTGLSASAQNE